MNTPWLLARFYAHRRLAAARERLRVAAGREEKAAARDAVRAAEGRVAIFGWPPGEAP